MNIKSMHFSWIYILSVLCVNLVISQSPFSLEEYQNFLQNTKNLTYEQTLQMHPAGYFKQAVHADLSSASYLDTIEMKYGLTEQEKSLLSKNGFVVTQRIQPGSFGIAFDDILLKIYLYLYPPMQFCMQCICPMTRF